MALMSYRVDTSHFYQENKMIDRACISINAICNLDCPYCHFGKKKNNEKSKLYNFNTPEVDLFINNLESYIEKNQIKTFKLGIVGSGEPMLSFPIIKHLVERLASSQYAPNIQCYMITNGTIMEDEHLDFFYTHKDMIDVNFSLDGYESLHNTNRSDYALVFHNAVRFQEKFGIKPRINAVVTKQSIDNEQSLLAYFKDNGFNRVNFSILFGVKNEDLEVSQQDYQQFVHNASHHGITNRQSNSTEKKYDCTKYGKLCGVGRTNIFITKQGVFPCARFMGNSLFKLGHYNDSFELIEQKLSDIIPVEDGQCFYEFYKIGG